MPEIFIFAGANGAGKTSFANEYLRTGREHIVFVNVDEIARRLEEPPLGKLHRDMRAGRVMLEQIEGLVSTSTSFMFETTLTSLAYAQKIRVWRQLGYRTALTYLRLSNVEMSLQRVRKRVAAGGHGIPKRLSAADSIRAPIIFREYTSRSSTNGMFGTAWKANSGSLNRGPHHEENNQSRRSARGPEPGRYYKGPGGAVQTGG